MEAKPAPASSTAILKPRQRKGARAAASRHAHQRGSGWLPHDCASAVFGKGAGLGIRLDDRRRAFGLSIVAPILVGYLIAAGMAPVTIFYLFAVPLVLSALCCIALGQVLRRQEATGTAVVEEKSVQASSRAA